MSFLPVLHLKATGLHNMTVSNDPCETTVTLYTFLRSTPTPAERDAAFHAFLDALHTAPSSGRGALTRKPNHQLVQLLTSVAVDDVFRSSPHVMPPLARHSDQWVRRLGYRVDVSSSPSAPASSSPLPTSSAASPPRQQEHEEAVVRAAEMRHYRDPYRDYEDHYARQRESRGEPAPHSSNRDEEDHRITSKPLGGEQGEEPLQYSGSTQPPEDVREVSTLQEQQQQQKNQYRSYLSAEVSALTNADSGDLHDDDDNRSGKNSGDFSSLDGTPRQRVESAGLTTTTSGGLHPVLELITRQVEQAVANSSGGTMSAQRSSSPPSPSSSLDQLIKGKILALTSRLDDVAEEVSDDMHTREAEEQAWTPAYSRLKTTMSFVEGLQARLGSAISLYQLQRYERETLQQARVAVQMEALSLQLILRDVRVRLEDAEEAPGGLSAEERELITAVREVLRAPENSNGEAE